MDISVDKRRSEKLEAHGSSCLLLDDLQENCMYNILGRLPLESLFTSRLVCKSWYGIITSPYFRNKHLHRLGLYTVGLIFSAPVQNYSSPPKKVFSIESKSMTTDPHPSFHIEFMEFNKHSKSRIREYNTVSRGRITASCDGLIVLCSTTRLILCNPLTKEVEDIPVGTISFGRDSYGLAAFSHASSRRYKLLHLFMKDKLRCEIMDIGSSGGLSWRAVDVPPTERFYLMQSPVFAMGALHWIQYVDDGHDVEECIMVSMPLDDEKYKTTALPPTDKTGPLYNMVFEMGEFLGFSSRGQGNQIEVWILRSTDNWEKQYDIDGRGLRYLTPLLYCEGDDKLVLKCFGGSSFYTYDRQSGDLTILTVNKGYAHYYYWTICPHVNTLVSWRSRR